MWLPRLTYTDLGRINKAVDLTDAAARALRQNRNSTTEAVVAILAEAQKPILEIAGKIERCVVRYRSKYGLPMAPENDDGSVA